MHRERTKTVFSESFLEQMGLEVCENLQNQDIQDYLSVQSMRHMVAKQMGFLDGERGAEE